MSQAQKFNNALVGKDFLAGDAGTITPLTISHANVDQIDVDHLNTVFGTAGIDARAEKATVSWLLQISGSFSVQALEQSLSAAFQALGTRRYVQYELHSVW